MPPAEKRGAKGRAAEGTFTCEALDAALADYLGRFLSKGVFLRKPGIG